MAITSNRRHYIPFHTTGDVKKALKEEAKKLDCSVSRVIHVIVRDALQKRGYKDVSGLEYKVR